jgi:endonuclease-3
MTCRRRSRNLGVEAKTSEVHRRLLETYGEPAWRPHMDPVSELVSTILSQNTNDLNRDVAFERLRARLPTWAEVRDADVEEVIEAIRPAGLANQKGPRIQSALRFVTAERGELDLGFLADWPVDEAKSWLTSITGVGPKTAAGLSGGYPCAPCDKTAGPDRPKGLSGKGPRRAGAVGGA